MSKHERARAALAYGLTEVTQSSPKEAAENTPKTDTFEALGLSSQTAIPKPDFFDEQFHADLLARIGRKARKQKEKAAAEIIVSESDALFWYGRHSNPHLEGTRSPARQEQTCLHIIRKLKLTGTPVGFFDRGKKGKHWDRPGLQRLVDALKANPGCRLVVENVDRLLRDAYVLYMLGPVLVDYDIQLFDARGFVDEQRLLEDASKAIYSYKKLCDISLQSLKLSMKAGRYIPEAPFGFYKPKRGILAPNADAKHVVKMFEMRAAGDTTASIARYFTEKGVPTPRKKKRWSPQTVRNILENMIYAGWTVYNLADEDEPVVTETSHTAIVDRQLFAKVQEVNDLETKSAFNPLAAYRNAQRPFLLSDGWFCPDCHGPLRTSSVRGERYMKCSNAHAGDTCNNQDNYAYSLAEKHMLEALGSRIGRGDFDGPFVAELVQAQQAEAEQAAKRRDDLGAEIEQLEAKLAKTKEDAFHLGMLATMKGEIEKYQALVEQLQEQRAAFVAPDLAPFLESQLPSISDAIEMISARVPFVAQNAEEERLRNYIQAILRSVVVEGVGETRVRQTTTFDFGAGIPDSGDKFIRVTEVEYDVPRLRRGPDERRERAAKLRDSGTHRLDRREVDLLLSWPVVKETFVGCSSEQIEEVFQAFALAVAADIPLGVCCSAFGIRQWHPGKKAMDKLRRQSDRTNEFIDLYKALRPASMKLGLVVRTARPARYLRSRFEQVEHPVLAHPLCRVGGVDRDMTDAEWARVLPGLHSLKGKPRFEQRAATARKDLDGLFCLLRRNIAWREIYPEVQAMNVSRRIWVLMAAGDIGRITRTLLVDAGIRSERDRRPIPQLSK